MDNKEKEIIDEILKIVIPGTNKLPQGQFIKSSWKPPKGYVNERFMVGKIPVEHLIPLEKKTNRVIFQIHGGGYLIALCDAFREGIVPYSKAAGGAEVYSVDYRVAPTNCYPAALDDAVKVYKWLLKEGIDNNNILVAGDSAGGNLALALTLYLKDKEIPLPKAVVVLSAMTNAANDFPSYKYNYEKDLVLGKYGISMADQLDNPPYFKGVDVKKDPYASPVLGDYKGFPSLLIHVGSYERLLDDSKYLYEKAKKAGVNVKLNVYDEMSHDFQMMFPNIKETIDGWNDVKDFIEETM